MYPKQFVDFIGEAITKEIKNAKCRKDITDKFDISAPMKTLLAAMTMLDALEPPPEVRQQLMAVADGSHGNADQASN